MTPLESANSPRDENFDLSSECGTEKGKSKKKFHSPILFYFKVANNFTFLMGFRFIYFVLIYKAVYFIG